MPIRIEVKKPEWLRHKSPEEREKEKKQKQKDKKTKEQQQIKQKKQISPSHESEEDFEQDSIIPINKDQPTAPINNGQKLNNGQKPASKLIQKQIRVKGKLVDGSEVAVTCDAIIDGEDIYVKNEGCTTEITPPPNPQSPVSSTAKTESNKAATSK